jgi:hypothetical protein
MKTLSKKIVLSVALSSLMYGSSWEDLMDGINPDQDIQSGTEVEGSLYESTFTYFIQDGDGIADNFSSADRGYVVITDANGNVALDTRDTQALMGDDELEAWAEDNADEILTSVFGGDPAGSMGGQDSATQTTTTTITTINAISNTSAKTAKSSAAKAVAAKKDKDGEIDNTVVSSVTVLSSETLTIKDNDKEITGNSGILSYAHTMESSNSLGLIVNYKYTKADDTLKSKTNNITLTPYYRVENRVNENLDIPLIFNLTGNLVYLESTVFPDGAGYLEYGAGFGIVPKYKVNKSLSFNINTSVQYLEKYIPESYVPEDAKWLSDAINNLKALQVASYGIGADYQIMDNWSLGLNALQTKHLVTDNIKEGREKATYYSATTAIDWNDWRLVLGYKIVEDLKDYEESAYMASISYGW